MGKPVKLLTVTSNNPFSAVVNVAVRLGCTRMFVGASEKLSVNTQAFLVGKAWEEIDDPDKPQFDLIVVPDKGTPQRFLIGPHTPELVPEDIDLIHKLWLEITGHVPEAVFHHRDVISLALHRFADEFSGPAKDEILASIKKPAKKERRNLTRTR